MPALFARAGRPVLSGVAVDGDRARVRREESGEREQQGGLARAVGAEERLDGAAFDGEVDVAERGGRVVAAAESAHSSRGGHEPAAAAVVDVPEVRLGDVAVGADRRGLAFGDDATEVEHVDVVAHVEHERDVVVDQEDAGAGDADVADPVAEPLALGGVEARGRFVEEEDLRVGRARAGDGHELALALAEVAGVAVARGRRCRRGRAARCTAPCFAAPLTL